MKVTYKTYEIKLTHENYKTITSRELIAIISP